MVFFKIFVLVLVYVVVIFIIGGVMFGNCLIGSEM